MRIVTLLVLCSTMFGLQDTHADTLLFVQEAQEAAKADGETKKVDTAPDLYRKGWYMRAEIGANFVSKIGNGTNDVEINLHPGMDLGLSFGYRFRLCVYSSAAGLDFVFAFASFCVCMCVCVVLFLVVFKV